MTLPYVLRLANQGWDVACAQDESLRKGLNIVKGKIVYEEIAEAFNWSVDAM